MMISLHREQQTRGKSLRRPRGWRCVVTLKWRFCDWKWSHSSLEKWWFCGDQEAHASATMMTRGICQRATSSRRPTTAPGLAVAWRCKNDDFAFKTMNLVLKLMNLALKTMNCVLKTVFFCGVKFSRSGRVQKRAKTFDPDSGVRPNGLPSFVYTCLAIDRSLSLSSVSLIAGRGRAQASAWRRGRGRGWGHRRRGRACDAVEHCVASEDSWQQRASPREPWALSAAAPVSFYTVLHCFYTVLHCFYTVLYCFYTVFTLFCTVSTLFLHRRSHHNLRSFREIFWEFARGWSEYEIYSGQDGGFLGLKNDDFTLKNDDFTLKNDGLPLKNDGFSITKRWFLLQDAAPMMVYDLHLKWWFLYLKWWFLYLKWWIVRLKRGIVY